MIFFKGIKSFITTVMIYWCPCKLSSWLCTKTDMQCVSKVIDCDTYANTFPSATTTCFEQSQGILRASSYVNLEVDIKSVNQASRKEERGSVVRRTPPPHNSKRRGLKMGFLWRGLGPKGSTFCHKVGYKWLGFMRTLGPYFSTALRSSNSRLLLCQW